MRQSDIIQLVFGPSQRSGLVYMLFRQSFRKDFTSTAGATFVALFSIIVTIVLVRTLGQAAGGDVDDTQVFTLILLGGLQYLAPALVITVFISVMAVVSRAFKEQEMTAWLASGLSLNSLIAPVLVFAIPLTMLSLVCSIWLTPWSKAELVAAKERFAQRSDVSKVSAGQFRESSDGQRIFFVERQNEATREVDNVFVVTSKDDQRVVLAAKSGSVQDNENGQRYLVLEKGKRFGAQEDGQSFSSTDFDEYGLAIKTRLDSTPNLRLKHREIRQVLADGSPEAMGEVLWRVSLPLSALTLGLLAIPLAFVNPRGGRSLNQIFALLIYLTYSNVVSVTQSMVVKGSMPFWAAFALPHVLVLLFFIIMLKQRNRPAGAPWFAKTRQAMAQKASGRAV